MVKYLTDEGKTISFAHDGSYAMLATSIENGNRNTLEEAKQYINDNSAAKVHTHITEDVTDASTQLAAKTHSHAVSELTEGAILLRVYSGDAVAEVEMENGSSFYYLNTTSKKIVKRTKDANGDVTEDEIGELA